MWVNILSVSQLGVGVISSHGDTDPNILIFEVLLQTRAHANKQTTNFQFVLMITWQYP